MQVLGILDLKGARMNRRILNTPHGRAFPLTLTITIFGQSPLGVVWNQPFQAASGGLAPPSLQQALIWLG